jgi:hypothetical protein
VRTVVDASRSRTRGKPSPSWYAISAGQNYNHE